MERPAVKHRTEEQHPQPQESSPGVPDHRSALRRVLPAAAAIVAVLTGVTVLIARSGGGQTAVVRPAVAQGPIAASPGGEFGPHYVGLGRRRQGAGVPTMMQTMGSRVHYHPLLAVYVDGRRVAVPANIGIDPTDDPMNMAGLHTHDASGTIHVEGVEHATLGQFFRIWGVTLSPSRLGGHIGRGGDSVRLWVDGKPSSALGSLRLRDGQRIVVSFGPKDAPPPALVARAGTPS